MWPMVESTRGSNFSPKLKLPWIFFVCHSLMLYIPADLVVLESNGNGTRRVGELQSPPTCSTSQFTCKSLDCIDDSKICDGVKDCADGSDETINACKQMKCPDNFFKCNYGACIEAASRCNGRGDCADNSDEVNCPPSSSNLVLFWRRCKPNEWRCKPSGKCILYTKQCDGKRDCVDGSDEAVQMCRLTVRVDSRSAKLPLQSSTVKPTTNTPVPAVCDVPDGTGATVTLMDRNDTWLNSSLISRAPKFSKVEILCNPGYVLPNGEKLQRSVCLQIDKWNPPLRPCLKKCPHLHSEDMLFSCYRDAVEIDCAGELVNGTTIRPRCRPLYHSENEMYRELRCQENGKWDGELSECVPDCGITNTLLEETQGLIIDGKPANASDSPWHVAIYRFSGGSQKPPVLICGGTLISAYIVVSAAHCFFDLGLGVTLRSLKDYEIVVSKYTRNYTIVDNPSQSKYKIRDLVFTDAGYNPTLTGQFSNDIVALALERKVDVNKFVLPACIDWTRSGVNGFQLAEGTPGKLVGWGVDKEKDVGSPILLYATLPYISFHKCLGKLKQIDTDKFCAGNKTGAGARKGDSGGGLMFRNSETGHYYLRGIVSTTDKDGRTSIATFTDVSKYVDWLDRVRVRVMRELTSAATDSAGVCSITYDPSQKVELFDDKGNWMNIPLDLKAPKLSRIEVTCNLQSTLGNGDRFQRSTCFQKEKWNPPLKACLKICPNLHPANMDLSCYFKGEKVDCNGELVAGTRLQPSCKTSYHNERKVDYRELRCLENGEWNNKIFECVPDCGILPTVSEQRSSALVDFSPAPWNVAIYKLEDGSLPTLQCSGTLITPNMIVSAANCFYYEDQGIALNAPQDYEILVSKYTEDYYKIDNTFQEKYKVQNIIFTTGEDSYNPHSFGHSSNNIVVLVTKKPVQMSKFVLPACTDWTNVNFEPIPGFSSELVGWPWGASVAARNLQQKNFSSIAKERCSEAVLDLDKICMESGATSHKTHSGEGLIFYNPENGRFFLRGISGRVTVQNSFADNMAAFTDVSKHVKWLKSIYDSMREDEVTFKGCHIPDYENKKVAVSDGNDKLLNLSSGSKAPKFSKIEITCAANYSLFDGHQKSQRSVCVQTDEWSPPLKSCSKMCPRLHPERMNLSCYRDDAEVDCSGDMIYGTRVQPRCEPYFKRKGSGVVYHEMRCEANGKWDHELFECVPDCGIPKTRTAQPPSTTTWLPANATDSPWNVAIFRRNTTGSFVFLCSGTLISANMIVSVAHWFYDSKKKVLLNSTADHVVFVNKYTTDYDKIDNDHQKLYKVREFIFKDTIRYSPTSSRLNDIVVLVLKAPVETDEFVLPACVEWNPDARSSRLVEGARGNLVSWLRNTSTNASAQNLHHTQLPFISFEQCYKKLGYVDPDKLCAGSDDGLTVHPGIGGAGLVFRDLSNERYFLRGVWSGKSANNNVNVGLFTDISKHAEWLKRVRDRVEKESTAAEQQTSNVVVVEANGWVDIK